MNPESEHGSESRQEVLPLGRRVPAGGTSDPDEILDLFLDWVADVGFELYPPQEEALLEIMAGRHVILSTPTGSGKSLVALGLHFKALCEGSVSFYTSPIKALASEKFFSMCDDFGADSVGMLTGDASINPSADVICCTAEVLANMALRRGNDLDAPYVVMDEFHYYSDPDRGVAWQIPLICLPETVFLLMSATLGDTSRIAEHIRSQTGREVSTVTSEERPVPLDFGYRETPLHETVEWLVETDRAPIYIVNFTQRECAELAQKLTSMRLTSKEEKERIREAIGDFRFDSPNGKEFRRFLGFGIGVHHAGLLPKYRLLVEQLSQQGLLKIISGTDTLGVGVNIPIRTVLFTRLAKFDGRKVSLLRARDFKQIAGRAGRKGFDERGWVVCQAAEDVIERLQAQRRTDNGKKKRKLKKPEKGEVSWTRETFDRLVERPPEQLQSRFKITNGMVLDLVQRDAERNDPEANNFHSLRRLVADCHEDPLSKARHLGRAAQLVRSLHRSGVLTMTRDVSSDYLWVTANQDLQVDFSLFHNLSLFLVEAIERLEPSSPDYGLDLLSLAESILEDPVIVLRKQVDRLKQELLAQLKAEGVSYEERVTRLDEVTHPQPAADFIYGVFDRFRGSHPWVGADAVRPKSVGREMFEGYQGFGDYVRLYGLQRSEGVLLRYLSQLYKTLIHNVPEWAKSEPAHDVIGFFRAVIERVDTSLIEEWESLLHPELLLTGVRDAHTAHKILVVEELLRDQRAFASRIRAELHHLVRALSQRDWEEAVLCVRDDPDDSHTLWSAERFEQALAPLFDRHGDIVFDHRARLADKTRVRQSGERTWEITQILVDPAEENLWCIEGGVDLRDASKLDGPLITVHRIGT